jgi:hypothetical protein
MKGCTILVLLLLGTMGCTSARIQTLPPQNQGHLSGLKTRTDVLNALGGPNNITYHEKGQSMFYTCRKVVGGGSSFSYSVPLLSIARKHICSDTVIFHVDSLGRVTDHTLLSKTDIQNHSIWPFSD